MVLLGNNKKKASGKRKTFFERLFEQFLNFSYKNIKHDRIILFDATLLVQKNAIREFYAERSIK